MFCVIVILQLSLNRNTRFRYKNVKKFFLNIFRFYLVLVYKKNHRYDYQAYGFEVHLRIQLFTNVIVYLQVVFETCQYFVDKS